MDRRKFLAGLGAGAVGWIAGGRTSGAPSPQVYAQPVSFIAEAEAAGTASAFIIDHAATARLQAPTFPQSVAAGDPNRHGAVIWTRVVSPLFTGTSNDSTIAFQVSETPDFEAADIVLSGLAAVLGSNDHTVSLPLQNTAMKPFTLYYYRFIFNAVVSRIGRFKTLPAAGTALAELRIGYVVCQDYSNGFYNAYGYLAQEEVDVVLFLGDYIYEYLNDGVGGVDNGPVRVVPPYPLGGQYPQGLADYRHLYQTYRADPQIQASHERFAFINLWDDHEFFNDCHQDFHEDTNPPGLTALSPQPALRHEATRAWKEYSLAAVPYAPDAGWENQITVYRKFQYGALLDLVVTDERLYRDGPPCGDVDIGERYETLGCPAQFKPSRTMLGAPQKKWFLNQVTQSTATWKLWANEVMLAQYKFGPPLSPVPIFFDLDQWDGYPDERAEILAAIEAAGVKNFVALSGDAHLFMTAYLKSNYNDPKAAPMGVELMVGAVSSGNYLDAGVDAPGAPGSIPVAARKAAAAGLPPDQLEPFILAVNPHMTFWNGSTWGYGVLTLTPDQLKCDFKSVNVKATGAPLVELASFVVPNGVVRLHQVG